MTHDKYGPLKRNEEHHSLKGLLFAKALPILAGHSKDPLPTPHYVPRRRRPDEENTTSSRSRSRSSSYQAPPPLFPHLPPRTHALSPVPPEIQIDDFTRHQYEQTQSSLFRLFEEIRLLVYEQVIGNQLLHIVRRKHKLGHAPCQTKEGDACSEMGCRGLKIPRAGYYAIAGCGYGGKIQLLQSCRRM